MDAIRKQKRLNVYVLEVPEQVSTDNSYREERYQTCDACAFECNSYAQPEFGSEFDNLPRDPKRALGIEEEN